MYFCLHLFVSDLFSIKCRDYKLGLFSSHCLECGSISRWSFFFQGRSKIRIRMSVIDLDSHATGWRQNSPTLLMLSVIIDNSILTSCSQILILCCPWLYSWIKFNGWEQSLMVRNRLAITSVLAVFFLVWLLRLCTEVYHN